MSSSFRVLTSRHMYCRPCNALCCSGNSWLGHMASVLLFRRTRLTSPVCRCCFLLPLNGSLSYISVRSFRRLEESFARSLRILQANRSQSGWCYATQRKSRLRLFYYMHFLYLYRTFSHVRRHLIAMPSDSPTVIVDDHRLLLGSCTCFLRVVSIGIVVRVVSVSLIWFLCFTRLYSIRFAIPHQPIRESLDCLIVLLLRRSIV